MQRVLKVEPTPSAPRGCITLIAREGGFRNINVDNICEVIGNMGAVQPRVTTKEVRQESREERRALRRARRLSRKKH